MDPYLLEDGRKGVHCEHDPRESALCSGLGVWGLGLREFGFRFGF